MASPRAHAPRTTPSRPNAPPAPAPVTAALLPVHVPRADLAPAIAPPPAVRAPEIVAAPPVHIPRAALDDPSFLVSIRPGSATIRVQPSPDVAAVTLRVGVRQGVATVRADGAAGAQLLSGHQRELEAALEKEGLKLGPVERRRRRSRS